MTTGTIEPRYPDVEVQLTGEDGNAFYVLGKVSRALRDGGVPANEVVDFEGEATSGDHNHLLRTCMRWVNVS